MDSTLGKVLSGFMVLLALAAVVVFGYEATTKSNDTDTVAAIFALAQNVQGDYTNNTAGYGTLSNTTVIDAGEAPPAIVKNGALVDPWGNAMSVGAISGNAHAFQVSFGPVLTGDCAQIASDMTSADGIQIGANTTAMTPPYDVAKLANACISGGGGPITLMYGGTSPLTYLPGTLLYTNNSASFSMTYYDTPPQYIANQYTVNNTTGGNMSIIVNNFAGQQNSSTSTGWNNDTVSSQILVNGVVVPAVISSGGSYGYAGQLQYQITIGPGKNIVSQIEPYQVNNQQLGLGYGVYSYNGINPQSGLVVSQFVQTGSSTKPY